MILSIHAEIPPLRQGDDGVVRIGETRIPLERVVRAFQCGMTAEQIAQDFDVLKVEEIYAVISYYLRHRGEVDAYLAASGIAAGETRQNIEQQFDPSGIRARLVGRRRPETHDP